MLIDEKQFKKLSFLNSIHLERWSNSHLLIGSQDLRDLLMQPFDLLKPGWVDQYLLGLINQATAYQHLNHANHARVYISQTSLLGKNKG